MPHDATLHIGKDPAQIALRINHVRLAVGKGAKAGHGQGAAVPLTHRPAGVAEHVKVQTGGAAKLGVLFGRIDRNADNLRVQLAVLVNVALKILGFQGAALRKGAGIKVEDGPLFGLDELFQSRFALAAAVGESKGRRLGAEGRFYCCDGCGGLSGGCKRGKRDGRSGGALDKGPS